MMYEPKRLHPATIIVTLEKRIKGILFSLLPIIFVRHREKGFIIFAVVLSFIIIFFTVLFSWISWYKFTYRFVNNELRIEHGIFFRKKRYIPLERIQSLDLSEGIVQRIFGLVSVKIETAGGGLGDDPEVVLSAITKQEASFLQEYVAIAKNKNAVSPEFVQDTKSIYKIATRELMLLSLTSGGVGVVISAVAAFLSFLDDLIPFKKIFGNVEKWAFNSISVILVIILAGFVIAWGIALIRTMLKYANFTVTKTESDIIISQGLLERRQITVPLNRIQAIRISQNSVRQLLGYGAVYIESAGGSIANLEGSKVMLLPMVKVSAISAIVESVIPDYDLSVAFKPVPKRAFRRYVLRSWYIPIPIVVLAVIFLKLWGLPAILLLVLMTVIAVLRYRSAGYCLESDQLSLRFGSIERTSLFMKRNRIQTVEMRESFFQEKNHLGNIGVFVKSGAGSLDGWVKDLEKEDIEKIYRWFAR